MRRQTNKHGLSRTEQARLRAFFRGKLLERRRQALQLLHHELASTGGDGNPVSGDFADMASSSSDREMIYGISSFESDALAQIDHALERIDEGTYGLCEECGARIPRIRLKVVPFATSCITCQEEYEREGGYEDRADRSWEDVGGADSPALSGQTIRAGRPGG